MKRDFLHSRHIFFIAIFLGLVFVVRFSLFPGFGSSIQEIGPGDLKSEISQKDFLLINVHTPYQGEIEKTDYFIEYDSMIANKDKLPDDKNARIVLYCLTGNMSRQAVGTLTKMGYTNVKHLEGGMDAWRRAGFDILDLSSLPDRVIPEAGIELPISLGDLGQKLVSFGVIDIEKMDRATGLTADQREMLLSYSDEQIRITRENSHFIVNLLWALGLSQKSEVYEEGPMGQEYRGNVGNFASTGGWTLGRSDALAYLNKYDFLALTLDQQERVSEIAKNIYRPCCGNNTWFPDCNHGMAALGAVELMVFAGLSDETIYENILTLNSYWFSSTYINIATYFERQGVNWSQVDAKEVLSSRFSSLSGAQDIMNKVGELPYDLLTGGSCGA